DHRKPEPIPPEPQRTPGEYTRAFGPKEPLANVPTDGLSNSLSRSEPPKLDWSVQGSPSLSGREDAYLQRLVGGPSAQGYEAPANHEARIPQNFAGPSEFTRIISSPVPMALVSPAGNRPGQPAAPGPTAPPGKQSGERILLF